MVDELYFNKNNFLTTLRQHCTPTRMSYKLKWQIVSSVDKDENRNSEITDSLAFS